MKGKMAYLTLIFFFLVACIAGAGKKVELVETLPALSYDQAWEVALQGANQMCQDGKMINPYNFPVLVSLGTSKSRRVITIKYDFDPAAGSVGTAPPNAEELAAKLFVPRFGAEFYMHIRLIKEGDVVRSLKVEVTQMKGVKKEEFVREAENLKNYYLGFIRRMWPR